MTKQIHIARVQDAYHYALAACPGGQNGHHETEFTGHNREVSPSKYLRMAYRQARAAGCVTVVRPRKLADAPALAQAIWNECKAQGISAYQGELLCTACEWNARDTGCGELCIGCHGEFKAAQAKCEAERADRALANLSDLDAAALGDLRSTGSLTFTLATEAETAMARGTAVHAIAATPRMPTVKVALTEMELEMLGSAVADVIDQNDVDARDAVVKPMAAFYHRKIQALAALKAKLDAAYNAKGDGPKGA